LRYLFYREEIDDRHHAQGTLREAAGLGQSPELRVLGIHGDGIIDTALSKTLFRAHDDEEG
jgi:hypothetical protein